MKYAIKHDSGCRAGYVRQGGGWTHDLSQAMTFDSPTGWLVFAASDTVLRGGDLGPSAPARDWAWSVLKLVGVREKEQVAITHEEVDI